MYHLELRQFPHKLSRFNLTEQELRAVVEPFAAEKWVEIGERKWNPHEAKITILEGPELAVQELSMGRGWQAALRQSTDVTERLMELATTAAQQAARKALEEAGRAALATDAAAAAQAPADDSQAAGAGAATPPLGASAPSAPGVGGLPTSGAGAGRPAAASLGDDPLALGVQLAALLGPDPAQLLQAWREVVAGSPSLAPSESLAVAEQRLFREHRPIA